MAQAKKKRRLGKTKANQGDKDGEDDGREAGADGMPQPKAKASAKGKAKASAKASGKSKVQKPKKRTKTTAQDSQESQEDKRGEELAPLDAHPEVEPAQKGKVTRARKPPLEIKVKPVNIDPKEADTKSDEKEHQENKNTVGEKPPGKDEFQVALEAEMEKEVKK